VLPAAYLEEGRTLQCSCGAVALNRPDPEDLLETALWYFDLLRLSDAEGPEALLRSHGVQQRPDTGAGLTWFHSPRIAEKQRRLLGFLRDIEEGRIRLSRRTTFENSYFQGNVAYSASNGWTMEVFFDADAWDYIDRIDLPDGTRFDYEELCRFPLVRTYAPSPEAVMRYRS
jgi:hypothetical protein